MVDVSVFGEVDVESSSIAGLGVDGIFEFFCDSKGYVVA